VLLRQLTPNILLHVSSTSELSRQWSTWAPACTFDPVKVRAAHMQRVVPTAQDPPSPPSVYMGPPLEVGCYSCAGGWKGSLPPHLPPEAIPDFGSREVPPSSGVALVGATPWVTNFNVLLATEDMQIARQVAREVSERGGGLPAVQTMALPHAGGQTPLTPPPLFLVTTDAAHPHSG